MGKEKRAKSNTRRRSIAAKATDSNATGRKGFYSSDGSQLFPTIALSDAYNTIMHVCACRITYSHNEFIGLGFLLVAAASFVGTLRFGFSEKAFATANGQLASVAALVGLPCIGIANVERLLYSSSSLESSGSFQSATTLIALVVSQICINSMFSEAMKEIVTILINLGLFVIPTLYDGYLRNSSVEIMSVILFLVGAVVIGPDREKCFLGMRCENWFHYCLGTSAYFMAVEFAAALTTA